MNLPFTILSRPGKEAYRFYHFQPVDYRRDPLNSTKKIIPKSTSRLPPGLFVLPVGDFFPQGLFDMGGNERADVAAQTRDFLDHARADESISFLRHHEDGFHL